MGTKIIAEIGSNWSSFEDCKNSIALAEKCGADAVKFQLFDYDALYGHGTFRNLTTLPSPHMPHDWIPKLSEKAKACGIEFMCTAFSPELIDVVDPYVETHKVASSDLNHIRMLEKLREIGKPVILSTGASHIADIQIALEVLRNTPVTIMYCVAAYPARLINFRRLDTLRETFGDEYAYGYSDHSIDIACIPIEAIRHSATVLEKHVNLVGATGPDSPHSLNMDEFKAMVTAIRGGEPVLNLERDMFSMHNRRLIATQDINPGDELKEGENFGIFRSLKPECLALSPWYINQVGGQISKKFIKCGDGISFDAF